MVNKQSLIFIPLIFMFVISMFSLAGIEGSQQLGDGYTFGEMEGVETYWYKYDGTPLYFTANNTRCNEAGTETITDLGRVSAKTVNLGEGEKKYACFYAWTGIFNIDEIYLYSTSDGNSTGDYPILFEDYTNYVSIIGTNSLIKVIGDFNSSYGLIALFISLMVGIGLAGIHFLGIGEAETSLKTIFMGAGFIAVWVVFSVLSMNLLITIPLGIGAIFYFGLTLSYVVGLIFNIGD